MQTINTTVTPPMGPPPVLFNPAAQSTSSYFQQLVCLFSPEVARDVVENHLGRNRTISRSAVRRYRADMETGVWPFTPSPLIFDTNGQLIDGQHRIQALAEIEDPQFTVPFTVALGLPPETIMAVDQGIKRTGGQQLHLRDVKNSSAIAAAARLAILWEQNDHKGFSNSGTAPSVPHIERWIFENKDLVDHVNSHMQLLRNTDATQATATGTALILAQIDPAAELEFFTALVEGGLPRDNPITVLDRRLAKLRRDRVHYSQGDHAGLIFRAWNAWRKGEKIGKLIRPSELTSFPVPV